MFARFLWVKTYHWLRYGQNDFTYRFRPESLNRILCAYGFLALTWMVIDSLNGITRSRSQG